MFKNIFWGKKEDKKTKSDPIYLNGVDVSEAIGDYDYCCSSPSISIVPDDNYIEAILWWMNDNEEIEIVKYYPLGTRCFWDAVDIIYKKETFLLRLYSYNNSFEDQTLCCESCGAIVRNNFESFKQEIIERINEEYDCLLRDRLEDTASDIFCSKIDEII